LTPFFNLTVFTLKATFNPLNITVEFLDRFRLVTDPLADNVVAAIIQSGQEQQINQILMLLMRNDSFRPGMFDSLGEKISATLDQYIRTSATLPEWANQKLISLGERVFGLYGPDIFMLLNVSSLPMCYCCGKGAQVLFDTGRLLAPTGNVDPLARRLMETAQMVVNVMSSGGLSENGRGIVTLQKVRLIHASIRYFLKRGQAGAPWDSTTFGEPINQEDLAGTLMSFGPVILSGLMKLGAKLSEEETKAWIHCWNIAGHLLGIDSSLLPDTYQQGFVLATKILQHQAIESAAGKALTNSCVLFMKHIMPGNAFDQVPPYLMWYFLQDFSKASNKDLPACIGINGQENLKDKLVLDLTHFVTAGLSVTDSHHGFVSRMIPSFNKLLLQGLIYHYNGGKGVQFFIPPSLQENWGLIDVWTDHKSTPSFLGNRITWQKKSETITNN
jgi:hypothetical protein